MKRWKKLLWALAAAVVLLALWLWAAHIPVSALCTPLKQPEEITRLTVQVDAGDYHSRQDSRLQELARALADKVRATGRSQSTRPLSAYQRRVIHLTLQDDPDVQTRSSGEGPLKRVVILRRKD